MTKRKARYKSYLLRLWQEGDDGPWRVRLQAVEDERVVLHFADIEALICYLHQPQRCQALPTSNCVSTTSK